MTEKLYEAKPWTCERHTPESIPPPREDRSEEAAKVFRQEGAISVKSSIKTVVIIAAIWITSSACQAEECITQGDHLNVNHSLRTNSIDPYAHLLPDLGPSDSLANTYNLDLKVKGLGELQNLRFRSSPAGGYSSPYYQGANAASSRRSPFPINSGPNNFPEN